MKNGGDVPPELMKGASRVGALTYIATTRRRRDGYTPVENFYFNKANMNTLGTRTGRISSRTMQRSNTPKPDNLSVDEGDEPTRVIFFGMHSGPRTKATHPYSYDPMLVFDSGVEPTGSAYSDRLMGWYEYSVVRAKMQKHFGEQGDYYSSRSPAAIQAFLRDLMDKPELELVRIEEHCNQATGYPVWFFAFRDKPAEQV